MYSGHFAEMKAWVGNQSWSGFLARTWPEWPWLLGFAVAFGGVAVLLVRWRHRAGDDRGALLVTAGVALVVPSDLVDAPLGLDRARARLAARHRAPAECGSIAILFTGWTVAVVPGGQGRERRWTVWQALAGNAYLLTALAAGAVPARPDEPGRRATSSIVRKRTSVRERRLAPCRQPGGGGDPGDGVGELLAARRRAARSAMSGMRPATSA